MKTSRVCKTLAGSAALLVATVILHAQTPPPGVIPGGANPLGVTLADPTFVNIAGRGLLWKFSIGATVNNVACSPDGALVAIASSSEAVNIVDGATGKSVILLKVVTDEEKAILKEARREQTPEVRALTFSGDGRLLAIGTSVGQVKIFNTATGQLEMVLDDAKAKAEDEQTPEKFHSFTRAIGKVASLAFSPDRNTLAVCGESIADEPFVFDGVERERLSTSGPGRLKIWDLRSGKIAHDLAEHSQVEAVVFSPDGKSLASAGRWTKPDGSNTGVILWDAESGKVVRVISAEANGGARDVAFSPDGTLLAICSQQFAKDSDTSAGTLMLVRAGTGDAEWQRRVSKGAKAKFSGDGHYVVAFSDNKAIRFFNVETGARDYKLQASDLPNGGQWNDFAVAAGSRKLVLGGKDTTNAGYALAWTMDVLADAPKISVRSSAPSAESGDVTERIAAVIDSPVDSPTPARTPSVSARPRTVAPPAVGLPAVPGLPPIAPPTVVEVQPPPPLAVPAPPKAKNSTRARVAWAQPGGAPLLADPPTPPTLPPEPKPNWPVAGRPAPALAPIPMAEPVPPRPQTTAELPATKYAATKTGRDIIRETKLKVLQKHFEETYSESKALERAALTAEPDERAKMESRSKAMKELLEKIEAELETLSAAGSNPSVTPKPEVKATPAKQNPNKIYDGGRNYEPLEPAPAPRINATPRASANRAAYSPMHATGAPDSGDIGTDSPLAWCPSSTNSNNEWLTVHFARSVEIAEVRIHEQYATGALKRVSALLPTPERDTAYKIWSGIESVEKPPHVRVITVPPGVTADGIRLEFDTNRIKNWQEIDAVELVGHDGSRQWANRAEASSYWGAGKRPPTAQPTAWSYKPTNNAFTSGVPSRWEVPGNYSPVRPPPAPTELPPPDELPPISPEPALIETPNSFNESYPRKR